MAETYRLRYDGLTTTLGAAITTTNGTSITFAGALQTMGTNIPTLTTDQYITLVIDNEIIHLTSYTSAATSGTISRGKEGTAGATHSNGATVLHAPTAQDFTVSSGTAPAWIQFTPTITQGVSVTPVANTMEYMILGGVALIRGYAQAASSGTNGQGIEIGLPSVLERLTISGGGLDTIGSGKFHDQGTNFYDVTWYNWTTTSMRCSRYDTFADLTTGLASGDQLTITGFIHLATPGAWGNGAGTGSSGLGALLGEVFYKAGSDTFYNPTGSTHSQVDSTNIKVSVNVPASGTVYVDAYALASQQGSSQIFYWAVWDQTAGAVISGTDQEIIQDSGGVPSRKSNRWKITGLTPGVRVLSLASRSTSFTQAAIFTGPTYGPVVFQVFGGDTGGGAAVDTVAIKTANYSAVAADLVLANAAGGGFTITAPAASAGHFFTVIKTDATANVVTVVGASGALVDGDSAAYIVSQYTSVTLVSDGTNWYVKSSYKDSGVPLVPLSASFIPVFVPYLPPDTSIGSWSVAAATSQLYYVNAGVQNDELVWLLPIGPGTYDIRTMLFKDTQRAILTVAIDDGAGNYTTVGTLDGYAGTSLLGQPVNLTGVVVTGAATTRRIRFKAATKNVSSGGYYVCIHQFHIIRTA